MSLNTLVQILPIAALLWVASSCVDLDEPAVGSDADADTDADTDADADTDSDTDSDADTDDGGPDTDTGECIPDCVDRECGEDDCGGYCGACDSPPEDDCLDGGVVDHFEEYQLGVCEIHTCLYSSEEFTCPGGSNCGEDFWGDWACSGQPPHGNFESATDILIKGWACDMDTPWLAIDIHFYFDSVPGDASPIVRTMTADCSCETPVTEACGGGGYHRFNFFPDSPLLAELGSGLHTVYAYGINTDGFGPNPQIAGSPITFTIP